MLSTAVALSLITTAGVIIVYHKLPRKMRRLLEKYHLATDVVCLVGTYWFLGGTITALLAAGLVGLQISALLEVVNHPNEYLYLYDLKNFITEQLKSMKKALNTYGEEYRQKQPDYLSGMQTT